jgi:hypothetical protein
MRWDRPHGYARRTEGKHWPLVDYGSFVLREYFRLDGTSADFRHVPARTGDHGTRSA